MKKKIYLSGPITTDKDHYKEHFSKIEEYLTNLGFEVTNPAKDEYDDETTTPLISNSKWRENN